MKTTAKDVVLLCKGWYGHGLYPTVLEALKQYYRKNYSIGMGDSLNEKFLFRIILLEVMGEISEKYPDRMRGFINGYLAYGKMVFGAPDGTNNDYDYQMFYRIVNFFSGLEMRGDGIAEIDTDEYFVEDSQGRQGQAAGGRFSIP